MTYGMQGGDEPPASLKGAAGCCKLPAVTREAGLAQRYGALGAGSGRKAN